ncbi:mCG145600 [Mus musculus]|nr:mCG145600 [Mus musculus]
MQACFLLACLLTLSTIAHFRIPSKEWCYLQWAGLINNRDNPPTDTPTGQSIRTIFHLRFSFQGL